MDDKKLIEMIEKDPDLYKILNSKVYIEVLYEINKNSIEIDKLKRKIYFKNISILYNILDDLIKKEFIRKIKIKNNEVYFITENGKYFIRLYENEKKKYDLN
jgi:predicted transcriptional regulator